MLLRLRLRAGLTQTQVAAALGLGAKHGHAVVSQLERGRRANPSFSFVLRFLRACKASPADLAELLKKNLSRPVEVPARPKAGRPRGPRIPKEDPAVLAMRKEAALATLRQVFEKMLHFELHQVSVPPGTPERQAAVMLGRAAFRVLFDTRSADCAMREARLARARKTAERKRVPKDVAGHVETKVKELFADMEREGELDWLPDEAEARTIVARSGRRRLETDAQMCRREFAASADAARMEFARRSQPIREGAERMVIESGITDNRVGNHRSMVTGFLNVARSTAPGSEERRKKLEEMLRVSLRDGMDESLVRRIADYTLAEWDGRKEARSPNAEVRTAEEQNVELPGEDTLQPDG